MGEIKTRILQVDPEKPEEKVIDMAAAIIKKGGLVAFPTETVYGLGADGLNEEAVFKIFSVKGRSEKNPLILHVSSWEQASSFFLSFPSEVLMLVDRFWPGPLTIVGYKNHMVPDVVSGGTPKVGVRMPAHQVALSLIKKCGKPLAAPSANLSGRPSPTTAEHVKKDLEGKIEAILDAGPTGIGIESTVLDITERPFKVLRPGAVTLEQLADTLGEEVYSASGQDRREDAVHYRPRVRIVDIPWGGDIGTKIMEDIEAGRRVGCVLINDRELPQGLAVKVLITQGTSEYGVRLYEIMHKADELGLDILYMELPEEKGLGRTLADRIRKAAGK